MKRYLSDQIEKDLKKKMVFLGGPRQVGKTTLAQSLAPKNSYLNWDIAEDREKILTRTLPNETTWIFDELHKFKLWRGYLKGTYDKHRGTHQILVTGSARLDLYRRGGDSLQGRYHYLRLHPLSLDEIASTQKEGLNQLMKLGGFPEPFLGGDQFESQRWSREYRNRILRDDILSIEQIEDIGSAELLMIRLPELVGNPLSIKGLSEDLQKSAKTIARWIRLFEHFYAIYCLLPFGSPRLKAVKKERKHYHFDWTLVKEPGFRFENLVASHLLKWVQYFEDTQGRDLELRFYRDLEQREVDFVIVEDKKPIAFIECKLSEKAISPHLKYLKRKFPKTACYQILFDSIEDFIGDEGIRVGPAHKLLWEIKNLIQNHPA